MPYKKASNEYLQQQRGTFARYCFVGDDDFLEIILINGILYK